MKLINKLICHFKRHVSLQRGQEYTSIYQEIKGYGAFGRGFPYVYGGRLYHCSRCGELHIIHGILQWEVGDLLSATLVDLPAKFFEDKWAIHQDYDLLDYTKGIK